MFVLLVFPNLPQDFDFHGAPLGQSSVVGAANLTSTASLAPTMPTEGSPLTRGLWLGLLIFGLGTIAVRQRAALKVLRQTNPFLLLFMVLAITSTVWSIEPTVTIRRFVRVFTVVSDGCAFALLAKSPQNFQGILRPILTAYLLASMVFVLTVPQVGIEQLNPLSPIGLSPISLSPIGAWRGLAPQKNVLGSFAATAFLLWLHAWLSKESPFWRALLGLIISAICLVESRSSTSLMAAALGGGLLLLLLRSPLALKRYVPYLIAIFACITVAYSLAVLNLIPGSGLLLSPITALTGKDLTFSGRTDIWQIIDRNIAFHPLLGGGYGAYWTGLPNSPSMEMLRRLYYYPTESHNGYLDVINDLGYVGAACLMGYLVMYLSQGLKLYLTFRSQGALYLTLLFEQLMGNLSEARWFNSLSTDFTVITIATVAMAGVLSDAPRRRARRRGHGLSNRS